MSTSLGINSNEGDGWRDMLVLVATLFIGCFFAILVAAAVQAYGGAASTLQSFLGVLSVALGYSLTATLSGLIPLAMYSLVYTFCVTHYRITYLGVAALAAGVVLFFEFVFQLASANYRSNPWALAAWGGLHAIPTAVVAHFLIKRLHRRSP